MATATTVPATTASQPAHKGSQQGSLSANSGNGRDKIHWTKDVWDRIDKAVQAEMMRTRVAQKFLPIRPVVPRTTSVPFDSIRTPSPADPTFSVDEGATTRLNEFWVEFSLTPQQVDHESGDIAELGHSTAVTLATRGANILAQAEDLVIFQGANGLAAPLFNPRPGAQVVFRGTPADSGLLNLPLPAAGGVPAAPGIALPVAAAGAPPFQAAIPVPLRVPRAGGAAVAGQYGANTFRAVSAGYSILQGRGQYGPYALVLHTTPYADTYAPVSAGLVITADRIKPLMTAGFYVSGTLPIGIPAIAFPPPPPANASFTGLLVSLGGNTMDVVVGLDATTAFMQQDPNGNYRFRVVERFALRLKDVTAVVRLEFE